MARGSVARRGPTWRYVIDLGPDPATGKRRQAWKGGFRTRQQAEAAMGDVVAAAGRDLAGDKEPHTVGAFLEEWLETTRPRLRPTTHAGYEREVERIKRFLGSTPLRALTPLAIEAMYAELAASGHAKGTALAPKTIRHTHGVLHGALADAKRLGLVARNAAASAKPPAAVVAERTTWNTAQLRQFLELIRGEHFETALMLAATTGMRRGEVLGLRWRDVDFDDRSLSVTQTITTVKNQIVGGEPKTPTSRRNIALDAHTIAGLIEHRRRQAEQRQEAGAAWAVGHDLAFPDETGRPLHPDRLRTAFERVVRRSDLPAIRFHDLRHSYATLALKAGVHPKVVSERLGHATIAITLDLYAHVTPGIDADAANADLIFGDRRDDS
jgi:integrase